MSGWGEKLWPVSDMWGETVGYRGGTCVVELDTPGVSTQLHHLLAAV